ncbi:hypothetical protein HO173_003858 [Letharia columbiana]|uniref:Uncharacterized protein n=1 Tax=Letharia columbiana TaxID=112416 RepID=A0A8H6FZL3_9LECA|nr:uncharacterized protein HO173_003858 [Letharia columbiana]KAF6237657.1 hypothetical protein HO173_003858 [Letharia columbiana]
MTSTSLSFGALQTNVHVGDPVQLQWFGNESVSILFFSDAFTGAKSNAPNTQPISSTLCLDRFRSFPIVSVIGSNITGESYTWTPSDSLSTDHYKIELTQQNEDSVMSLDIALGGGETNSDLSDSYEVPPSGDNAVSSTESTETASFTQASAAASTSSSSKLASGHSSPLAPLTATVTALALLQLLWLVRPPHQTDKTFQCSSMMLVMVL